MSELLALAKKFVSEWEADVAAFLSNDLGSVVAILDRVLKEKTTCCDDMCSLSAHLQRLVGLYFKLLQLRIKPTMLKTLRVWIWTISIVPYVLTHFGYDFSLPHTLPVLQHYQHIRTLSLSDLKKISSAGKHLLADLTDMFVIHGVHIITHKKTVVSIVCALEDAASTGSSFISKCKQCKSAAAAQELQQSVIYISKYLVLHREFYFARLMNLLVVPNPAVSEETSENQAQEVYCWCRQGELLASQMVFCDSCNVWFHYTCMGLLGKKAYGFGLGRQATGLSHSWCMFDPNHDKAGLKKLKSEEEPFLCIRCSEEKGLNYPYAW
ncbi:hypothetical protein EON65_35285 [archaeon]|nr:MAG: hypothetical protein EON65_35285 [archaeon]